MRSPGVGTVATLRTVARAVFNAAAPIFVKADAGECKKARTRGRNVAGINYAGAPMKGIVWAALVAAAWANAQPPSAGGLNIDPRCGNTSVSPEDAEALRQLDELTKTLARAAK